MIKQEIYSHQNNKTSIVFASNPTTEIRHPSTEKPALDGGVWLNPLCQGTQKESRPYMHEVKAERPLSRLWCLQWLLNQLAASQPQSKSPCKHQLRKSTWSWVLMRKSSFSQKLCLPHSHTFPPYSQLPVGTTDIGGKSKLWQVTSKCAQKSGSNLWDRRRPQV